MIRIIFVTLLLFGLNAHAQPIVACTEDAQCIVGYFCEIHMYTCRECLRCKDLGRESSESVTLTDCIRTAEECGSCLEGLVKDYNGEIKAKCVQAGIENVQYFTIQMYLSCIAALIGFILMVIFVYVYRTTRIFKVVAYLTVTSLPRSQKKIGGKQ